MRCDLMTAVSPRLPECKHGRPPHSQETMLRRDFMQQWFALSYAVMEEALHEIPVFREFAWLEFWNQRQPDESTVQRFQQVLETHNQAAQILKTVDGPLSAQDVMLKNGTVVDAALISAPSSTEDSSSENDPEIKQDRKGQQWILGRRRHIGVDVGSGLVRTAKGTSGAVNDEIEAYSLVRYSDRDLYADTGDQGAGMRPDDHGDVIWHIAKRPGKRRKLYMAKPMGALPEQMERVKAGIRARVEHIFGVLKRQFSQVKVRDRRLAKNSTQLRKQYAQANLWMVRHKLLGAPAIVRPRHARPAMLACDSQANSIRIEANRAVGASHSWHFCAMVRFGGLWSDLA